MTLVLLTASHFESQGLAARMPPMTPEVIGVGPVAAALGAATAIATDPPPSAVILLGLAGTRDPDRLPVGSVLQASEVVDEAVGAGHGHGFVPLADMGLPAADRLPERIPVVTAPAEAVPDAPWVTGPLGMVAAASADGDDAAGWRARHPEVLAEEMEGYAVALACRRASAPLAILRGISNVAGDRDHSRWRFDEALDAVAHAATIWLATMRPPR